MPLLCTTTALACFYSATPAWNSTAVDTPYGPPKAALESETVIWAQDLKGTGITVNAVLPGGATLTGMIPDNVGDAQGRNCWHLR